MYLKGPVSDRFFFSIYTTPLFDIVSNHLPTVHCYADDTQLYLAFQPDDTAAQESAVASMEACIQDIRNWMTKDSLKINDDKTEVILIGTKVEEGENRQPGSGRF